MPRSSSWAAFACLYLCVGAVVASPHVRLTVSYCPGLFAGLGAVVDVDPSAGGDFSLTAAGWKWPDSQGVGCPENQSPNFLATADGQVQLDFTSEWGLMVEVDAASSGNVTRAVQPTSSQLAFDGFVSWREGAASGTLLGLTPAAAQHGFCSDGCLQFGVEAWPSGRYHALALVPFKAAMTDVAFYDATTGLYHFQGSYPLQPAAACSSVASDQCLIAINATTGAVVSSVGPIPFTVYNFAPTANGDGTVTAFVEGIGSQCDTSQGSSFGFARVDLTTGRATLTACMDATVAFETVPLVSAFSPDGALFAGNAALDQVQLVVLDTASGKAVLNSKLPGIKKALRASTQAPFVNVWGLSWA